MPHTSRKKKKSKNSKASKREEVGDDGWTRIVNTQREPPTTDPKAPIEEVAESSDAVFDPYSPDPEAKASDQITVPAGAKIENIRKKYDVLRKKWLDSAACKALMEAVEKHVDAEETEAINTCILLGSGSLCGVGTLLTRQDVAIIQVAIFKSFADHLEKLQGSRPKEFAQEPLYNAVDVALLANLGITVIEDPKAFELMDDTTIVYMPSAEQIVALGAFFRRPGMVLGSYQMTDWFWRSEEGRATTARCYSCELDGESISAKSLAEYEEKAGVICDELREEEENSCRIMEKFMADHVKVKIPNFEYESYPFHNQALYVHINTASGKEVEEENVLRKAMEKLNVEDVLK